MAVRVVEVVLPNQAVALVRAADLDEGGQVAEKVGWKDTFDFADVSGTLARRCLRPSRLAVLPA